MSEKQIHRNEKKRGRKRRQSPQRSSRRLAKSHQLPVKIEPVETVVSEPVETVLSEPVEPSPPEPIESPALNENYGETNGNQSSDALNHPHEPLDEIDQIKKEMPATDYQMENNPIAEEEPDDLPDETDSLLPIKDEPSDSIFGGIESFLSIEDSSGQFVKSEVYDYDGIEDEGKF